jgi:transcriptional regulator with XRE-family HTH domain
VGAHESPNCPVARRLKEARLGAGLSQRRLGIAAGIDPGTASTRINRYERGAHIPDYSTLTAIAHVLNVPVAWFYADRDDLASWILAFDSSLSPRN